MPKHYIIGLKPQTDKQSMCSYEEVPIKTEDVGFYHTIERDLEISDIPKDVETLRFISDYTDSFHICENCLDDPNTDNHHYSERKDESDFDLALRILEEAIESSDDSTKQRIIKHFMEFKI